MRKILLLITLTFFLAGCANIYNVKVDNYLDSTQIGSSIPQSASFFVIVNKEAANPIFEKQVKSRIESLLKDKGYKIEAYDKADYFIEFAYEASTGRIEGIKPIYHESRVETVRTYSPNGKTRFSYIERPPYTSYVPYRYNAQTSVLTLTIVDANVLGAPKDSQLIWISESSLTSRELGLREAINYLLIGAFKLFGKDTHTGVSTEISENDPQLKKLLNGE